MENFDHEAEFPAELTKLILVKSFLSFEYSEPAFEPMAGHHFGLPGRIVSDMIDLERCDTRPAVPAPPSLPVHTTTLAN